jgi:hypothetical protein
MLLYLVCDTTLFSTTEQLVIIPNLKGSNMESEVDYDAYMDVLAEENREFLTTIPPDQIAEYLCTFENWQQYLPFPLEPPSAIELAESISISHIKDLAYILAFEYPKITQELREELDYYHKRMYNANLT